ncbi:RNA polymerase sigma factor [Streptomyces sp. NPDC060048]|uniref:RNA polymerase sigma factor n=1 Tax=unclassified Streptomyces TaxID=2593676 RepID=UPI0036B6F7FE
MVGEGAEEEFTPAADVAQRLLEAYAVFVATEPEALRRSNLSLALATCQDIVQEAYLRVGQKAAAGELDADTNVMAYLRTAVRNLAVDEHRKEQRQRKRLVLMGSDALDAVPSEQESGEGDRTRQELVRREIRRMPQSQQQQVVDLQSRGFTDVEIATVLGIPAGRLHKLRNKAVSYLKRKLTGHIRDGHRKKKNRGRKDR